MEVKDDELSIGYNYNANGDLDSNNKPFKGMNVTQLLTNSQIRSLEETTRFNGIDYTSTYKNNDWVNNKFNTCKYYVPKTVGYYQLRNTYCNVTEPFNTYMFVSDANAPTPLYDVAVDKENPDDWWNVPENAKKVSDSLFLYSDFNFFNDIGSLKVRKDIGVKFYNMTHTNEWDDSKADWKTSAQFPCWKDILNSNVGYYWDNAIVNKVKDLGMEAISAGSIDDSGIDAAGAYVQTVFQSLRNPYTNTNLVLATRNGYSGFKSAGGNWSKDNKGKPIEAFPLMGEKKKSGDVFLQEQSYLFMMGLPAGFTGLRKSMYEGWRKTYYNWVNGSTSASGTNKTKLLYHFTNIILENVFGVAPPLNSQSEIDMTETPNYPEYHWVKELWEYAKNGVRPEESHILNYIGVSSTDPVDTGTATVDGREVTPSACDAVEFNGRKFMFYVDQEDRYWREFGHEGPDWYEDIGTDWIDTHLCPYPYWGGGTGRRAAGEFCKGNCTEKTIENIALRLCERYTISEDPETHEQISTYRDSYIGADIYVLYINRLFSALSSTMKHDDGPFGQRVTGYSYSRRSDITEPTRGEFSDDNYILTKAPTGYVTIDYKGGENGETTGSLKIVVLDESLINGSNPEAGIFPDTGGFQSYGVTIFTNNTTNSLFRSLYWTINQTHTSEYPIIWKYARHLLSRWATYHGIGNHSAKADVWKCDTPESREIVRYVKEFYDNMKIAMPGLMAYRYQHQVFAEFTNKLGKSLVDYEDPENTIVAKALPIMDVDVLKDLFFDSFNGGNFEAGKQFSYSHCIVDLDPDLSKYNKNPDETNSEFILQPGEFPMKFASGVTVNVEDYKTSKLVLKRIDNISGEKLDTFTMGSHATDYDLVTDPKRRKYRDNESIVDGAEDDFANVTLGNGGSYQKKRADIDLKEKDAPLEPDDLYNCDLEDDDDPRRVQRRNPTTGQKVQDKYEPKYFKNKHFFIDPFALTISQWCYIKLNSQTSKNATKETARALLTNEGNLEEIERSYWRYVCVWGEPGEWSELKQEIANLEAPNSQNTENVSDETGRLAEGDSQSSAPIGVTPTEDDEKTIQKLCDDGYYNPLKDTRPYYYATYNDVRGTGEVYYKPEKPSGIEPEEDWKWANYVIDSNKGDEFQMNTRSETESFMDILNSKVVFQTQKRIYKNCDYDSRNTEPADSSDSGLVSYYKELLDNGEKTLDDIPGEEYDELGESPLSRYLMEARDQHMRLKKSQHTKWWCRGKEGGINFDLPTEAQWEYCCRDGSTYPVPPISNLGDKFEENFPPLDLIAWYKFKVIGSLPEPERFCAWRVSKMLFGIGKDKEQINNVYEKEE